MTVEVARRGPPPGSVPAAAGLRRLFAPRRLRLWVDFFSNKNGLYAVNNRTGAAAVEQWLPREPGVVLELGGGLGSGAIALLEQLGGRLDSGWLAGGEYDAVLICQLPDQAGAAALSMAAAAAGAVKTIKTTPLMTVEESLDALQRAAAVHSQTSGRTPPAAGLPVPRSKPVAYKDIFSSRLQQIKERMGKIVTGR